MDLSIFALNGKVAVVTGGNSGIGKGIAEGLADAGADIVIAARRFEQCREACSEIETKTGVRCLPVKCDVTKTEDANGLIESTVKEFGKIDILVNSAGVGMSDKPVVEMSDEDWDATLNINLRGTFLCSRAAAREMIKRKQGKIIDVSSIYGTTRAIRNAGDYCASKAGVIQLAKVMALELARYNIQINVICPGYFLTPMNYEFLSSEVGQKVVKANIPMQRPGNVNELKGIAIYLASPASSFTTGAEIVIDGGHII